MADQQTWGFNFRLTKLRGSEPTFPEGVLIIHHHHYFHGIKGAIVAHLETQACSSNPVVEQSLG